MRQVLGGNADARVGDGQSAPCRLRGTRRGGGAARRRVPQRIRREVLHRLLQPMRIADQADVVFVRLDHNRDALVLRRLRVTLRHPLEELVDVDVLERERNAAGLEAREVEQILDQPLDALAFLVDHLDGALPFLGRRE